MNRPPLKRRRRGGIAAIELAVVMAATAFLVPTIVVIGGLFQHYAALNKAVHEGARYLASLPPQALNTDAAATQAVATTRAIVIATAEQAGLQTHLVPEQIYVSCGIVQCHGVLKPTVQVTAAIRVSLPAGLFYQSGGSDGMLELQAGHTMRYGY